jgi:hypothetical protein
MSKIVVHRGSVEQIVELSDVQVFRADDKNVTVRLVGADWFVKNPKNPTLKALYALSDGGHIYASKSALIAVSAIVGRVSNYEMAGHYGAVVRDGQIVKVSRRESAAFNRIYRELVKNNT